MMAHQISGYPLVHREQVRWGDLDAFGHVNNTVFFRYFESARIAYFQAVAMIDDVTRVAGIGPILAQTGCQFVRPIRFPTELLVGARVSEIRTTSFKMEYIIVDAAAPQDPPFAQGDSVIVMIDYGAGTKVPISAELRARMEAKSAIAAPRS